MGSAVIEAPLFRVRRGLKVAFRPDIGDVSVASAAARSLALAHRFHQAVEAGEVGGYRELAGRLGVSFSRISAVASLVFLAPEIQEEVLGLRSGPAGGLGLRELLQLSRLPGWDQQRAALRRIGADSGA